MSLPKLDDVLSLGLGPKDNLRAISEFRPLKEAFRFAVDQWWTNKEMVMFHLGMNALLPLYGMIGLIPGSPFGMVTVWEFYLITGLFYAFHLGSVFSSSRSLYAHLVPEGKEAQFFGLYEVLVLIVITCVFCCAQSRFQLYHIWCVYCSSLRIQEAVGLDRCWPRLYPTSGLYDTCLDTLSCFTWYAQSVWTSDLTFLKLLLFGH